MNIDHAVHDRIVSTTGKVYQWKSDDTVIDLDTQLSTDACSVYRASNRTLPGAGVVTYAVLPNGQLAGGENQAQAAADVLRSCGAGKSAAWWSRVVSSFIGNAVGLVIDKDNRLAIGAVEETGQVYAEPRLERNGAGATLDYFVMRQATQPARVHASLPASGPLQIEVENLHKS
ncbi:MAG: hypothetical protein ACREP7_12740 [Lysobacter sp.]